MWDLTGVVGMVRATAVGSVSVKKKKKKFTMRSSCLLHKVAGGVLELCRGCYAAVEPQKLWAPLRYRCTKAR